MYVQISVLPSSQIDDKLHEVIRLPNLPHLSVISMIATVFLSKMNICSLWLKLSRGFPIILRFQTPCHPCLLVCLGSCIKMPETHGLSNRYSSVIVLEAGKPRVKVLADSGLVKTYYLAWREPTVGCIPPTAFLGAGW